MPPLPRKELDAVLAAVEPAVLEVLRGTYLGDVIAARLAPDELRFAFVEWSERRRGLRPALLAELSLLAKDQAAAVQRETAARRVDGSAVEITGPRPLAVTFMCDGAAIDLWCTAVTMNDFTGEARMFLLAPLAALEGRTRRPDDLPALSDGVSRLVTIAGRKLEVSPAAIDARADLAVLAVPAGAVPMATCCRLDDAGVQTDAMIGWVCEGGAARWCHGLLAFDESMRRLRADGAVTPLFVARGVSYQARGAVDHLDFSTAAVHGFATASGVRELGEVRGLVAQALIRGVPWRQRLTWAVGRLFPGRGDGDAARPAADDPRLLDVLHADARSLEATRGGDLVALTLGLNAVVLLVYCLGVWVLHEWLVHPWGGGKFLHQARMGLGVLVVAGLGVPALYGARAGVLATMGGAVVGLITLVVCNAMGEARTTAVASATAGALFGAVLLLGSRGEPHDAQRLDRRRTLQSFVAIGYVGLTVAAGYGLTRMDALRGRVDLLAPLLGLLLLGLVAPVVLRLLRAGRSGVRGLVPVYGAVVSCLLVLIAVGIAFAREDNLKGLFEGAAFAGVATTLLFILGPTLRATTLRTQRLVMGLGLPLLVTVSFRGLLAEDRWVTASAAFVGGLWLGALLEFVIDAAVRRTIRFS